jgi:hypothetical protein
MSNRVSSIVRMSTAELALVAFRAEQDLVRSIECLPMPHREELRLAFKCLQLAQLAVERRRSRDHSHACGTPACWPAELEFLHERDDGQ